MGAHVRTESRGQSTSRTYLDHDGHLPELPDKLLGLAIIDTVFKGRRELSAICNVSFPALSREDFATLGPLV